MHNQKQTIPVSTAPLERRKTLWQRIWRVLLIVVLLIVLLALTGFLYQTIASAVDTSRYPAPGRLIDVGGFRLHLYCTGTSHLGSPTVILEAGGGGSSLGWGTVQPGVASFTRVCSYDRAGYGWSDNGPLPRTAGRIVTELHTLLARAAVPGPYVLVGHSFGGLIVRLYAYTYPQQVAGLVLVDSISEEAVRYPELRANVASVANLLSICQALAPFGIVRLLGYFYNPAVELPPTVQPVAQALLYQTRECYTAHDEVAAGDESYAQVRAARHPLGHLPLVVLTRGVEGVFFQGNAGKPVLAAWLTLQKGLASLSTNSQQIIATRSGHNIQLDQPDLVIAAIKQVLTGTV
jgi:pimeloyl-ACP methyl ester carboxylesterase